MFGAFVDEIHDTLQTLYWLLKLHEIPCKSRFIDNSSLFSSTELSKLFNSCLTTTNTCYKLL